MQRIVLIMPVYNEATHLQQVLASISAQTFDHRRLYFVAIDGGSTDKSRHILEKWLQGVDIEGSVLTNPLRKIPISLNLGLDQATSDDIIARIDAHTLYGSDYLSLAIQALENAPNDVACVGSAQIPAPGGTFGQRVVEALYTNPMGLGGADFRRGSDVREVEQAYLPVWRPGILQRAGPFNEELQANEDAEMAARIRALGCRILRVPLPCRYIVNKGPLGSLRQWHRYGYWRARMLRENHQSIRARHVVILGMAVLATALLTSPVRAALVPIFAAYAALIVRNRAQGESPPVTIACLFYFPVLQFAFSAGLVRGFIASSAGRSARTTPRMSSGE